MEVSKFLLRTLTLTLDAVFKASEADIRVHGINNVPVEQPVLYVINHFTRLETVLMPYIIDKYFQKYPLSLAHHSFFQGSFGRILEKLGSVSTINPERDRILMGALLKFENPVIIFPEGQMIKDKRIIEKGKFMVYNTGLRRPPHTGAAQIALRTQFYREKIKYCHEKNYIHELNRYIDYFGMQGQDIKEIIAKKTYIVPVNITYYPIRARNNSINKIVNLFLKDLSDRVEEELQVEGTMIIDGVDIDINFGEPLLTENYLYRSRKLRSMIRSTDLYLEKDELKKEAPLFRKIDVALMHEYMDSIYSMTTVNHDHIFAYLLSRYPFNKIDEVDFKNRANLAIGAIRELNLTNFHTTLVKKQHQLQTDDFHFKYDNFIKTALSDGLVTLKRGYILKHRNRFRKAYQFHAIRKDNIVEVLRNEIAPLKNLISMLNSLIWVPSWVIRKRVRDRFFEIDRYIFEKDYQDHFIPGETKPKNIGAPFFLRRKFAAKGVLLIHGYLAAPEEIREVADILYKNGYTVYGPRLRGHGTSPEDLANRKWEEWYTSVNRAYVVMRNTVKEFIIAGFSTGGGLALLQAANKGAKFSGVVSVSAPLKLHNIGSKLATAVVAWNTFLDRVSISKGKKEFIPNRPENPHINYFRNPVHGVSELEKLMNVVEQRLPDIRIPTLIIQASDDPVVNPVSAQEIYDLIGTRDKEKYIIYSRKHGIMRGRESEKVAARILAFCDEVFTKS